MDKLIQKIKDYMDEDQRLWNEEEEVLPEADREYLLRLIARYCTLSLCTSRLEWWQAYEDENPGDENV